MSLPPGFGQDQKMKRKDNIIPITRDQFKLSLAILGYIFFIYGMVSTYADIFTYNGVVAKGWEVGWFVVGAIYCLVVTAIICLMWLPDALENFTKKHRIRFKAYIDRKFD